VRKTERTHTRETIRYPVAHSREFLPHLQAPSGLPQIEGIRGPSAPQGPADPPMPWHNAWRLRVFLFVFLVVPLPGLAWAFCARPSTGPWPRS